MKLRLREIRKVTQVGGEKDQLKVLLLFPQRTWVLFADQLHLAVHKSMQQSLPSSGLPGYCAHMHKPSQRQVCTYTCNKNKKKKPLKETNTGHTELLSRGTKILIWIYLTPPSFVSSNFYSRKIASKRPMKNTAYTRRITGTEGQRR